MDNTTYSLSDEEKQALYVGEVELSIATPVDLKMASKLYNSLQTIPESRILLTRGTVSRGAAITIVLDKPIRLIETLSSKLPDVVIIPEIFEANRFEKSPDLQSIVKKGKKKRVILIPKEAYHRATDEQL